jgi:hypothetical protein
VHPHTASEAGSLASEHYGIEVRTVISLSALGINDNQLTAGVGATPFTSIVIPTDKRGIKYYKAAVSQLLNYEPFDGCTISADIDQPVAEATIRMRNGNGIKLSPYLTTCPAWDLYGSFGVATPAGQSTYRPLLDAGVYIQLQGRYISAVPRQLPIVAPTFVGRGTLVQTSGTNIGVTPAWPAGHIANDVALLIVETAAEAATLSVPAGFVQCPGSPQSVGTAGGASSVRLQVYWCRATSNSMPTPTIVNPGNHVIARILAWRGCVETGNPFNVTPVGNTLATASTSYTIPSLTLIGVNNRLIHIVAGATDTTVDQLTGAGLHPPDGTVPSMNGRTDSWRDVGNGGGFTVTDIVRQAGATGTGVGTLATATVQARMAIALVPPPQQFVVDSPSTTPWRPFFTGRIDTVDPAADDGDTLVLTCRDLYSDVLDAWIVPQNGNGSFRMDNEDGGDDIGDLLGNLFGLGRYSPMWTSNGVYFAVVGSPNMIVPTYMQDPMSMLLAMRTAGLQNAWDLRAKWGTPPYLENQLVLTYYEPDRTASGFINTLGPARYFTVPEMGLSRDEVRNLWRVTPSNPPRQPVEVYDEVSWLKYGPKYAAISEDATSLIETPEQALVLANGLLSDTREPKVTAQIERRFYPYVEINDIYILTGNNVHHDQSMFVAVTGYSHTITEDGNGTTTMRCRRNAAAASLEWRQRIAPARQYLSTDDPTGVAIRGARWQAIRP